MLKYDEFKAKLVNGIKNNIPKEYKNYSIELHSIKKLNQSLDGICILDKNADTVVSPVIYADELYGEYIKTDNLDTTIMLAVNMLIEHFTDTKSINISDIENNTVAVLLNYEQNKNMLKNIMYVRYREFAIVFRWIMKCDNNGVLGCLVNNEMAKALSLDEDTLYVKSLENMRRLLPVSVKQITDLLSLPRDENLPVFVLGNKYGLEGAAYILQYEIMRTVQNAINTAFYILLPCIHEALLIPQSYCTEDDLKRVILAIRNDTADKTELLSNKVYLFDKGLKEVK